MIFEDLGLIEYKKAWDYQEQLLSKNLAIKAAARNDEGSTSLQSTKHHLLFCEHYPVYTLGKSGSMDNVLLSSEQRQARGIEFYQSNRGGDITFHGLQQVVGYPILDLEKFTTDIGKYLRNVEEAIILTLAEYGIKGERSPGETGVWIEPGNAGKERKICAIGVRCSRWVTMHGFALNVNTDLTYFDHIVPCGIKGKGVTSMEKELNTKVDYEEVKEKIKNNFCTVFEVNLFCDAASKRGYPMPL